MAKPLCVMTYNVWLMPPLITGPANEVLGLDLSPCKRERARAVAEALPEGVDVLVLCEAFCDASVALLCGELARRHGLVHRTRTLGSRWTRACFGKLLSGGVVVVSRHPLRNVEEVWFGLACARDDGFANKGCVRVTVEPYPGTAVHVFATHTQAWKSAWCLWARRKQLGIVRRFVGRSPIASGDVVLVVGDLNVDKFRQGGAEYRDMLKALACDDCNPHDDVSFDHVANALSAGGLSSGGKSELLDYVLVSSAHRRPAAAAARVVRLVASKPYRHPKRGDLVDLSDHYPVICEMDLA